MAVGILLSLTRKIKKDYICLDFYLDNNACYWYMYPFFEAIGHRKGLMIDLYDDAIFFGKDLDLLETQIIKIEKSLDEKPEEWEQKICETCINGKLEEVFAPVQKKEILSFVEQLLSAIDLARKQKMYLMFLGD